MKLGELEKDTMQIVWNTFPNTSFTVRDIVSTFAVQKRHYAYNTVLTVITHLFEKRLLRRKKDGKTFLYTAAMSQEVFLEKTSREFVKNMQKDFGDIAVAYFANVIEDIDPSVLKRAKERLNPSKQ